MTISGIVRGKAILLILIGSFFLISAAAVRIVMAETQVKRMEMQQSKQETQKQVVKDTKVVRMKSLFPRPNYDSGWITVKTGDMKEITHNVGGNAENYVVDMQFRGQDDRPLTGGGINAMHYGGDEFVVSDQRRRLGAYWFGLTNKSLYIGRLEHDQFANKIRIRIWVYD